MLRGRETERAAIDAALDSIRNAPNAGAFRISGLAGTGKTAFLSATVQAARDSGWLVLETSSYLVEQELPLATVERLLRSATAELGERAATYTSGLAALEAPGGGGVEEAFCRLLEGLLVDFPVALAADDVQWLDSDSEIVLSRVLQLFAAQPLALLVAERGRESKRFSPRAVGTVNLGALDDGAIEAIARTAAPEASDSIVAAIVASSAGHPLTAEIIARKVREARIDDPARVPASIRTVVAREIDAMNDVQRELLHTCAVMDEPFEARLLDKLFPDVEATRAWIEASIPTYLRVVDAAFCFSHAAIAEAVRQTIPVDAPLRLRVLHALQSLANPALGDYERMRRQANASGDRALERDALLTLARQAVAQKAWSAAAGAFRRAFALAEPIDEDFARSYTTYAMALNASDDSGQARTVLEAALESASRLHLERGFGELAAMYMAVMWYGEESNEMVAVFERYVARAVTPEDRLALYATLALHRAMTMDAAGFAAARRDALSQRVLSGSEPWLQRVYQGEAFLTARMGDYAAAEAALAKAAEFVDRRQPMRAAVLTFTKTIIDHYRYGIAPIVEYLDNNPPGSDENQLTYDRYLRGFVAIARGELSKASLLVEQGLVRRTDRVNRRRLLSIAAAVSALSAVDAPYDSIVEEEVRVSLPGASESALTLISWRAASIARERPKEAAELARVVLRRLDLPFQPTAMFSPLPLALYAARARDEEMLRALADDSAIEDGTRWHRAQKSLVRGIARAGLGRDDATSELSFANAEHEELGAPLFAEIAAHYAGREGTFMRGTHGSKRLSPREAQIGAFVAEGRSAAEIATTIGLSRRTVERHIELLRSKLITEPA
ncbi:MAG TPA: AAA family ATPase [Candidatus Acidoferrales bacterium]|jgi:hypothetical protein|nr:AAA family ATPase [Candidatus Acidoferrales bacterium]